MRLLPLRLLPLRLLAAALSILSAVPALGQTFNDQTIGDFRITTSEGGMENSCSIYGPASAPFKAELALFRSHGGLSLEYAPWKLRPDSHGPVTLRIGDQALVREFRADQYRDPMNTLVTDLSPVLEPDDKGPFDLAIAMFLGRGTTEVALPNGEKIQFTPPPGDALAALQVCRAALKGYQLTAGPALSR